MFAVVNALALFTGSINLELRKNSLRLMQLLLICDTVKFCIDGTTHQPYLSIPTYFVISYKFLFPTQSFRVIPYSSYTLLNQEERTYIKSLDKEEDREKELVNKVYEISQLSNPKDATSKNINIFVSNFHTQQYFILNSMNKLSLLNQTDFIESVKSIFEIVPGEE